jgi:glycosyltransferase involved in cell wall biosynthesis
MILKEQSILLFTRTMDLGGTEKVVLQLCEILKPSVKRIIVCSCGGVNVEELTRMGICHYQIPDIEQKNPKVVIHVAVMLHNIIKKEGITLIHTHHRMAAFYVAALGLYRKCVYINTSHSIFKDKRRLTYFAYRKAHLIACGEMVKKNLIETFGLPKEQVKVVYNAVKSFDGQGEVDITIHSLHEKGYFVVGNVCRLSKQKGVEYYIQAIPFVLARHPKTHFLIVGSGENMECLRKLGRELNIMNAITFMGYRSDVQNIMSQMDLIVSSSLREGLPLTPMEVFSVGKSIVATDVDGTVEVVENGVSGILVESEDSQMIAKKINWMIEHPEERKKMESEAKARFEQEFSMDKFASGYLSCYEQI